MDNKQLLERAAVSQAAHEVSSKWIWQMDYCKKQGWPPANNYFWKRSEQAYNEHLAAQSQEGK
jgi:hypothetical protein